MENLITPLITIGMVIFTVCTFYVPVKISKMLDRRRLLKEQRECVLALSDGQQFSGYRAIPAVDRRAVEEQLAEVNVQLVKLDNEGGERRVQFPYNHLAVLRLSMKKYIPPETVSPKRADVWRVPR